MAGYRTGSVTEYAPYGTWPSPLSPDVMGGARVSLAGLQVVGDACWWSESRPRDGGRMVVMRLRGDGPPEEISPEGVSVRSRVHEYGGAAHFAVGASLLYTDLADQALWWLDPGAPAVRLTPPAPAGETHRYADARPVAGRRLVVSLRERHHDEGVDDEVVLVDRLGQIPPSVLLTGRDFFAAPRPSPDGRRLAWLAWDHPNMPWDGTELWVADLQLDGSAGDGGEAATFSAATLSAASLVAGGPDESVGQPTWAGDDLWFVSDRAGWWQPYRFSQGQSQCMATDEVEFAGPDWVLGQSSFVVGGDDGLLCQFRRSGRDRLGLVDSATGTLHELEQPCVAISGLDAADGEIFVLGATATAPPALYRMPWPEGGAAGGAVSDGAVEQIHRVSTSPLEPAWVSTPEELTFETITGAAVPLLFFAPHAPGRRGAPETAPPLVVVVHGGPTAGAQAGFDAAVQLWTTRGVAVAVVDYRGSTGHGRRFRRLLDGAWGVADVEDCRAAAAFLAHSGRVDGRRMVVKGSSAGGLTALRCLDPGGPFAAAVVAYGVTDLEALAADTHKFESRYLDRLIGPWPGAMDVYRDRSPARHPERVEGAVLLMQGSDDPIVPPDQAERMVVALRSRGVRCDHVVFEGEGHGFRRAETLTRCAELEIAFVLDVLGIDAFEERTSR
jgi:dipeptidyl aminopeptidase/acylaminoacyl peptidase